MDDSNPAGSPIAGEFLPFVQSIQAAQPKPGASLPQARAAAEAARAPWRAGGPTMARVREVQAPGPSGSVRVRLYEPSPQAARRAALVYLHGGGWTLFSLDTHDRLMREYAAGSGLVVAGIDYALSPEARHPRAREEVVAALRWLAEAGEGLGIDARRLIVGGDSAGANLALAAALTLREAGDRPALAGLLLNYGVFDARSSPAAVAAYGGPQYMLSAEEMAGFWENYLAEPAAADDPLVSPLRARLEGLPPAFLAIAECDILAEQGLAMAQRLEAAGVPTEAILYRGAPHSFLEAVSIAPTSRRAFADQNRWLSRLAAGPLPDVPKM